MTDKLIEITNSDDFYQNCDFYLESKQLITSKNQLELIFSINQISYDIPVEYKEWKIICNKFIGSSRLDNKFLMPYIKIAILKEHPLLWEFHEDENECFIKGTPKNLKEFYGEFDIILEEKTGNWIKLTDNFWNLKNYFEKDVEKYLPLSNSMAKIVQDICKTHNIDFKIKKKKIGADKGWNNLPNSQLLILGNEQIVSHNYNLKQSYIIAENFEFTRIK